MTMGDPTGIGPEIMVKALDSMGRQQQTRMLIVGDQAVLAQAAKKFASRPLQEKIDKAPVVQDLSDIKKEKSRVFKILSLSNLDPTVIEPGNPGHDEGKAMCDYIQAAVELINWDVAQALVTCPINKRAMLQGGSIHGGHTELLASLSQSPNPVMMLDNGKMRVALVTTHVPMSQVAADLKISNIVQIIKVLNAGLISDLGIEKPNLAIAGLNPHSGEEGTLGTEELDIIAPAVSRAREAGIKISGPFPADTLFVAAARGEFHAVVCMYHDQGLIPLKMSGFESAVNVTLGLPFVRTSPGHGTAPDIAWQGKANPAGLVRAITVAAEMAARRRKKD